MKSSWAWRENYRVWDANRKVFLYPENWIEPEPRPASRVPIELAEVAKVARAQRASVAVNANRETVAALLRRFAFVL